MQEKEHLVIVGNGIAGVTLAQQVRSRSDCRITIVSAESATHFSRPALMYVYMGHMRYKDIVPYADWYWKEHQLELVHDRVERVDFGKKQLQLKSRASITYDKLVLATGSCPALYDWPGQEMEGVQGLVTLQDLELLEKNTAGISEAVVVGGGLIGVELAEMLQSRGIAVTMLVREELYWQNVLPQQEAQLVTRHIRERGITLRLKEELAAITPDTDGRVRSIITKNGEEMVCQFVGIATGVKPNVDFLQGTALELSKGVLVNKYFETNLQDVYAIGDCAEFRKPAPASPAVEQLWYTARKHGEALAKTLTEKPQAYLRGPWFNSAKFFDIEYQTYGYVPAEWDERFDTFYWEHHNRKKAIRLFYQRESAELKGINLLGVRYRHDLCHHWLQNRYTIHMVIKELPAVNFDPEFFQQYEEELIKQYIERYPQQGQPTQRSKWWHLRDRFGLFSDSTSC
ncbi:MAG: NAD(P)/FAD-dependent oxidoreductase [Hymenobacteraceae bacterium]|nr:NAD(P)/FAD-dependent oxidoreductase [Hymenobacteraceae bacterium]MDX5421470.1 NAD(P)/FAD-dependent oxidoreductase [Hymenobacteraceae bacterium]